MSIASRPALLGLAAAAYAALAVAKAPPWAVVLAAGVAGGLLP